jgi:hypothetical protein
MSGGRRTDNATLWIALGAGFATAAVVALLSDIGFGWTLLAMAAVFLIVGVGALAQQAEGRQPESVQVALRRRDTRLRERPYARRLLR